MPERSTSLSEEAARLAEQRRGDLDRADRLRGDTEEARIRKDERDAAHTAEQDRHLAAINGSVADTAEGLKKLSEKVGALQTTLGEYLAVAKALAERGISTRTFVTSVCVLGVMIIALFVGAGGKP